ncbi:MAG: hypothetical protein IKL89_07190 [Clostridia bacterium]|nr:hypothetical protein [Clostridia bacterium]
MHAKVLIGADSESVGRLIEMEISRSPFLEPHLCRPVGDGPSLLAAARHMYPDILILDEELTRLDGLSVLRELRRTCGNSTAVVFIAPPGSEFFDLAELLGVDCVMAKPLTSGNLVVTLENICFRRTCSSEEPGSAGRDFCEISGMLQRAGVPAHLKGYQYLRESIRSVSAQPQLINAVTKELYPKVAHIYGSTPARVERAIRHAIGTGWIRGEASFLRQLLGYGNDGGRRKPSNSEFIAAAVERLNISNARTY